MHSTALLQKAPSNPQLPCQHSPHLSFQCHPVQATALPSPACHPCGLRAPTTERAPSQRPSQLTPLPHPALHSTSKQSTCTPRPRPTQSETGVSGAQQLFLPAPPRVPGLVQHVNSPQLYRQPPQVHIVSTRSHTCTFKLTDCATPRWPLHWLRSRTPRSGYGLRADPTPKTSDRGILHQWQKHTPTTHPHTR